MEEIKCEQVGMLSGGKWDNFLDINRRVYSANGISPTLTTMDGGHREVKIAEPIIYDDYNGRIRTDQDCIGTLTTNFGSEETSDTLTTVQKDNLVVESNEHYIGCAVHPLSKKLEFDGYKDRDCPTLLATDYKCPKTVAFKVEPTIWGSLQKNCAKKKDGICPTLTSAMGDGGGQIPMHNYDYRIRKLTPDECFRLQGVKQEDFERVAKNQSTSSLYHLAGDSITTTCLMAIFGQLFGVDYESKINELVEELRQQ